ncbi:unnamed protein product [Moneuplotes crassus]|uniref:Endonuclease/exonuclease/phosphatase domain-containing protein n=1 Tax=Euplotes crassus TaxID=5936 RepID=A0AAD1U356_EUPCR|nr:unnamed protein product [Moneuplotes crassus]
METTPNPLEYFKNTRKWVPNFSIEDQMPGLEKYRNQLLTIMSYNVLAESYLSHVDYGDVEEKHLSWDYRHKLIQDEIEYLNPDIICMQELEDKELTKALSEKTERRETMPNYMSTSIYKIGKKDCVCIFWKSEKFESVGTWSIEFNNPRMTSHLYNKQHVASFVALKMITHEKKRLVIVGTTHLLFNMNRGDIKLAQLDLATQSLAMIKESLKEKYPEYEISTVFCGDFNSISRSGIYQYLSEGKYDCSSQNRNDISGQKIKFSKTEKGYKSIIQKLQPNPYAEVLKLPQWYLEITNTKISVRKPDQANVFIEFWLNCNLKKMMRTAANMEKEMSRGHTSKKKRWLKDQAKSRESQDAWPGVNPENYSSLEYLKSHPGGTEKRSDKFVLTNHAGKFKSVYPEGMKLLKAVLFEESKENPYFDQLDSLGVDREKIKEKYKKGDTIFGAFKPNFENKKEFNQYWHGTTQELAFSSYFEKKQLIDYILFQGEKIQVNRVLDVPCMYTDLSPYKGSPNECIPSDHLPIMAEFYIS